MREQRKKPSYFESIKEKTAQRWNQLETDKELAAPWWQMFKQIQSPRHVLSELLQNADDAGAKNVNVKIENNVFIFEHDGKDFSEEEFSSLCKFGMSNKCHLHTIGFRGIGFKSTFSIGDVVEIITPTISIRFNCKRFTEPVWIEDAPLTQNTRISVKLKDENIKSILEKTFDEWTKCAVSLLFFRNIQHLTICGKTVRREVIGKGPVEGSERVKLVGENVHDVLLIVSPLEQFPSDAIDEIRQERQISEEDFLPPSCTVEIVVGLSDPQRLYVVLPTNENTQLPFSINAPFIQDPARLGIKDPSISPTNRWLLNRIGHLAIQTMKKWLAEEILEPAQRAKAYSLLPKSRDGNGKCDSIVLPIISDYIGKDKFLLASNGSIVKQCFVPPEEFYKFWDIEQISIFAGKEYEAILSKEVSSESRTRLKNWKLITIQPNNKIVEDLETHTIPRPNDDIKLIQLWKFIQKNYPYYSSNWDRLKILPVEGSSELQAAAQLVRVEDITGGLGLKEEDLAFLSNYLQFLDRAFLHRINEKLKDKRDENYSILENVFNRTNLNRDSTPNDIIKCAYAKFYTTNNKLNKDWVHFTHIIGFLDVNIPDEFMYITRDNYLRSPKDSLALDISGELDSLLPEKYANEHLLHDDYIKNIDTERKDKWIKWAKSSKSGLLSFVGISKQEEYFNSKDNFINWIKEHGGNSPDEFPIRVEKFFIIDYGFDLDVWKYIEKQAVDNPQIWTQIFSLISYSTELWREIIIPKCYQCGYRNKHKIDCTNIHASWICQLATKPCIPDKRNFPREPHELLMRNEKTEMLIDIEHFVHNNYDKEKLHDLLLALGVRDSPGSPDSILNRIKIFVGHDSPPEYELVKLYKHLDELLKYCQPYEVSIIKNCFNEHPMIYTHEKTWAYPHQVFRTIPENGIKGIFSVMPELRDLSLWGRIGVLQEPTMDILIELLKKFESNVQLKQEDKNLIRSILNKDPSRVWSEIGYWLSLDGLWKSISTFSYYTTGSNMSIIEGLSRDVKEKTADMSMVGRDEITNLISDSSLKDLQSVIKLRISNIKKCDGEEKTVPWMKTLGRLLIRAQANNSDEAEAFKEIGRRLSETIWISVSDLELMPYLERRPVGRGQSVDVFWDDRNLYVRDMPRGRLHKVLPTELGKECSVEMVKEAITHCYERDIGFINEYCKENFTLNQEDDVPPTSTTLIPSKKAETAELGRRILHIPPPAPENTETGLNVRFDKDAEQLDVNQQLSTKEGLSLSRPTRVESTPQLNRKSLIEILADKYQFKRVEGYYTRSDGSYIQRAEEPFHWEVYSSNEELLGRLWMMDEKLSKGIEIPAEVWNLIKKYPNISTIVLRGDDGGLDIFKGTELLKGVERNELELILAKYRLMRNSNDNSKPFS